MDTLPMGWPIHDKIKMKIWRIPGISIISLKQKEYDHSVSEDNLRFVNATHNRVAL